MKIKCIILSIVLLLSFSTTVNAIGGGYFPGPPPEDWMGWGAMPDLSYEGCWNDTGEMWYNPYIDNPVPDVDDWSVPITAKGVQTCVNITIDPGCVANVTFQWLNYHLYYGDWVAWATAQNWYDEDDDDEPDGVDWASEPTYRNDSYWFNYSNWSELSHSQTLCEYNANVSCFTWNNWETEFFDWRVIANFTCGDTTYNTTCYFWFTAEECPVSYIYPPSPNGTVCPCCDCICANVTNELGHPMNITIFLGEDNTTFFTENSFYNVSNDTYCFCLRDPFADAWALGHTGVNQTTSSINTWKNVTFTYFESKNIEGTPSEVIVPYTGHYDFMFWISTVTHDSTPNGKKIAVHFTQNGLEINGSYRELDYERKEVYYSMNSFCHADLNKGDLINFQFIVNDVDNMISKETATWTTNITCAYATIELSDSLRIPMIYNKTYYWYVNITDTVTGEQTDSAIFQFTTVPNPNLCPCGYDDLVDLIDEEAGYVDYAWVIGIAVLFGGLVFILGRKRND